MFNKIFLKSIIGVIALASAAVVNAGPPLVIDDPGVLDPGQWEFITAVTTARAKNGEQATEAPVLDVSVGLTENTQMSVVYPYVFAETETGERHDDFGNLQVGYKWRFINTDRLQVAVAPGYTFGISVTEATLGIGSDTAIAYLPIDVEYALSDKWTLSGEIGYAAVDKDEDEWAYGAALGRTFGDRATLWLEVYGATESDFGENILNYNVGLDFAITDAWHVLAALGSGIHHPSGVEELDYTGFLGIQYFTGM